MQKLSISFLGRDCPGIVANVCQTLSNNSCNILQLTQSILGGEFAAIYIVDAPDDVSIEDLQKKLEKELRCQMHDISVLARRAAEGNWSEDEAKDSAPYVVTADGPDGPGLIATMAKVFSRHTINIESIKAVLGHGGKDHALFVFEVGVPEGEDIGRLRREVQSAGRSCGLTVSMQHRDIFEAMHRISDH